MLTNLRSSQCRPRQPFLSIMLILVAMMLSMSFDPSNHNRYSVPVCLATSSSPSSSWPSFSPQSSRFGMDNNNRWWPLRHRENNHELETTEKRSSVNDLRFSLDRAKRTFFPSKSNNNNCIGEEDHGQAAKAATTKIQFGSTMATSSLKGKKGNKSSDEETSETPQKKRRWLLRSKSDGQKDDEASEDLKTNDQPSEEEKEKKKVNLRLFRFNMQSKKDDEDDTTSKKNKKMGVDEEDSKITKEKKSEKKSKNKKKNKKDTGTLAATNTTKVQESDESKTNSTSTTSVDSVDEEEEEDDEEEDVEEEEEDDYEGSGQNSTQSSKTTTDDDTNKKEDDRSEMMRHLERRRALQEQMYGMSGRNGTSTIIYNMRPTPARGIRSAPPSSLSENEKDSKLIMTLAVIQMTTPLITWFGRLWFAKQIARLIHGNTELMEQKQHFIWECVNDKYIKDQGVWKNVLSTELPPLSMDLPPRRWNKVLKDMKPKSEPQGLLGWIEKSITKDDVNSTSPEMSSVNPSTPASKTVVVVDLSTSSSPIDNEYMSDVVTFLVGAHNTKMNDMMNPSPQLFGPDPEIVLNIESPGGEVTAFALAAAQILRLRNAGWTVTVCVDRIAASGGYMIASQANQIISAPFAVVGSIGVIQGGLNYNKIAEKYGIKPIEVKSGDRKNPLSPWAPVTSKEIGIAQEESNSIHRDFINLCLTHRPMLVESVCDGRTMNGERALEAGLVDRILTSDEYLFEKMSNGDIVMKLHRFNKPDERIRFLQALNFAPSFFQKIGNFLRPLTTSGNSKTAFAKYSGSTTYAGGPTVNYESLINNIFTGVAFLSMIHGAMKNGGIFGSKQ